MYVCLCKGITDRDIAEAVLGGACSFNEVRTQLGVSSQCGKCARLARAIVEENMPKTAPSAIFYDATYGTRSCDPTVFDAASPALA